MSQKILFNFMSKYILIPNLSFYVKNYLNSTLKFHIILFDSDIYYNIKNFYGVLEAYWT